MDRPVPGFLAPYGRAAVGDHGAGKGDAHLPRLGHEVDPVLGFLGITGSRISHRQSPLWSSTGSFPWSSNRLGRRRLLRSAPRGAAVERGDTALVQLWIAYRPAFLGDPLGAKC